MQRKFLVVAGCCFTGLLLILSIHGLAQEGRFVAEVSYDRRGSCIRISTRPSPILEGPDRQTVTVEQSMAAPASRPARSSMACRSTS